MIDPSSLDFDKGGGLIPAVVQDADTLQVLTLAYMDRAHAEARLNGQGRVLIRKSGTEPLIRVMAEAEDEHVLREVVDGIVAAVEKAAA